VVYLKKKNKKITNNKKNLVQKNLLRDKNLFANITAMQF